MQPAYPPAYPVASDSHDALNQLKAGPAVRAVREREAEALAGAHVAFVSENLGPLYDSREDALAACGAVAEDVACRLVCRIRAQPRGRRTRAAPVFRDGERWPRATAPLASVWQVSVSYWKVLATPRQAPGTPPLKPARALRRKGGESLTTAEVLGLTETPMTAVRPQKALDFGLFDFPLPENPGIVIADE